LLKALPPAVAPIRIRANTETSGEVVAICDVLDLDNSQVPAAAVTALMSTSVTFPLSGTWIVAVAVPPAIDVTIERFQLMLARNLLHHSVLDNILKNPSPVFILPDSQPLPGALHVEQSSVFDDILHDKFCK
jgi:hypothetical protein